ncbi:hypothetical protein H8D36_01535 [archaeon]|nr:hypothetical protein [archaeon]MBL7057171.1 hypothetical protein [Candidatus Woesearchaeota archaeon]
MDLRILEEIGLTQSETKVYLALLELGSTTTGKIVDKSRASSSKIYEILDKLMQKGLASYVIKSGTKYFEAAPPERIMDYLKEKEKTLQAQKKDLKSILPELELKKAISQYTSEATIYKGMKGLETAFNDIFQVLKKGDTVYTFIVGNLDEKLSKFFIKHYQRRAENGILSETIFSDAGRKHCESRKNLSSFKAKILPTSSASPATIVVYGNKASIRIGDSDEVICIVIDNKNCAKSFKEQFDLLWNQKVIVYEGFEQVTQRYDRVLEEQEEGDKYYVMGAHMNEAGKEMRTWLVDFHTRRVKRKVSVKFLVTTKTKESVEYSLAHAGDPEMKLAAVKVFPKEYQTPMQINLFKDNRIFIFLEFEEPMFFEIQSESLYKTFKTQFDLFWEKD